MIPNKEKEGWHYLVWKTNVGIIKKNYVKTPPQFLLFKLSSLFCNKSKLESHEKVCKKKIFVQLFRHLKKNTILEFNQYMKSDKVLYMIYADIESLIEK